MSFLFLLHDLSRVSKKHFTVSSVRYYRSNWYNLDPRREDSIAGNISKSCSGISYNANPDHSEFIRTEHMYFGVHVYIWTALMVPVRPCLQPYSTGGTVYLSISNTKTAVYLEVLLVSILYELVPVGLFFMRTPGIGNVIIWSTAWINVFVSTNSIILMGFHKYNIVSVKSQIQSRFVYIV